MQTLEKSIAEADLAHANGVLDMGLGAMFAAVPSARALLQQPGWIGFVRSFHYILALYPCSIVLRKANHVVLRCTQAKQHAQVSFATFL